jgi:hypothetical protein
MRITFHRDGACGEIDVPKGEYWVSLRSDTAQIVLSGAGKDILVPGTKRRTKARSRNTSVTFFSAGGTSWNLVIQTPKHGEWVAFFDMDPKEKKE